MPSQVFLVCLKWGKKEFYFSHTRGLSIAADGMVLSQPEGIFTPALKEAKLYHSKWVAQITASEYEGAVVKTIEQVIKDIGGVVSE